MSKATKADVATLIKAAQGEIVFRVSKEADLEGFEQYEKAAVQLDDVEVI